MGYQGASSKQQSVVLSPRGQALGAFARLAVTLSATLALAACAAPSSYMGISFAPGLAASDLQDLARRAQAGDKQAQLDLGIAYEEGRGVAVDIRKARKLYQLAGSDSGGAIWLYSPSVGNGTRGRVVSVNSRSKQSGLVEAKIRMERLN